MWLATLILLHAIAIIYHSVLSPASAALVNKFLVSSFSPSVLLSMVYLPLKAVSAPVLHQTAIKVALAILEESIISPSQPCQSMRPLAIALLPSMEPSREPAIAVFLMLNTCRQDRFAQLAAKPPAAFAIELMALM